MTDIATFVDTGEACVDIGEKAQRMIQQVLEHDAFQTALAEQNKDAESVG